MFIKPSAFYRSPSGRVQADKAPEARLEFGFDWSEVLGEASITSATWTSDEGIILEAPHVDGAITYCWVRGGVLESSYEVICTVALDDGRTDSCSFVCFINRREPSI